MSDDTWSHNLEVPLMCVLINHVLYNVLILMNDICNTLGWGVQSFQYLHMWHEQGDKGCDNATCGMQNNQ